MLDWKWPFLALWGELQHRGRVVVLWGKETWLELELAVVNHSQRHPAKCPLGVSNQHNNSQILLADSAYQRSCKVTFLTVKGFLIDLAVINTCTPYHLCLMRPQ
jgi:hypothetical protein